MKTMVAIMVVAICKLVAAKHERKRGGRAGVAHGRGDECDAGAHEGVEHDALHVGPARLVYARALRIQRFGCRFDCPEPECDVVGRTVMRDV